MFFRNTGTDVFMSGISKQEGGIPMKISKKMLAAAVLAFAFGVAGCGGGGGSSGDPTPKKRRSKSACSGDCQSGNCRNDSTETSWVRYEG